MYKRDYSRENLAGSSKCGICNQHIEARQMAVKDGITYHKLCINGAVANMMLESKKLAAKRNREYVEKLRAHKGLK